MTTKELEITRRIMWNALDINEETIGEWSDMTNSDDLLTKEVGNAWYAICAAVNKISNEIERREAEEKQK